MAFTQDSGRQYPLAAVASFTYDDFTSGTYLPMVEVPSDAIVIGGFLVIDTVFDSGTTDTFTVGDSVDDDEYGSAIDGQAAALTAITPTGYKFTANGTVGLKLTSVGTAATQGAGRLVVQYVRDGRSNENQG